ncbi:uncharacterized protein E0L32_011789 [Thyridium curvatum]|uniref:CorA-like transporter domain-containing protein n=1 Tax=Thyridium curvatum TaxID=1093900 RepID=A0A507BM75_9PEZI|nr:uncharacterized protein E0L32_011789 [Thyridium curvatum]TPX18291.1 hypothetical protein E0L32_011789 [Thyridium curvatum]
MFGHGLGPIRDKSEASLWAKGQPLGSPRQNVFHLAKRIAGALALSRSLLALPLSDRTATRSSLELENDTNSVDPDPRASEKDDRFWQNFEAEAPNLFVSEDSLCDAGVLEYVAQEEQCSSSKVSTWYQPMDRIKSASGLKRALERELPSRSSRLILLSRANSWSRIKVTTAMFKSLYNTIHVSPFFLKIMTGFGRKISSTDENFMTCYTQLSRPHDLQKERSQNAKDASHGPVLLSCKEIPGTTETGYNLRHFERHGRDLCNPWSCRQSAIHHSYNFETKQSSSILIQPPRSLNLDSQTLGPIIPDHPLGIHAELLLSSTTEWKQYLNDLSDRLTSLYTKIAISKSFTEFQVDFASTQKTLQLRLELHQAHSILENTLDTIKTLNQHEGLIAKFCTTPVGHRRQFRCALDNISRELRGHLRTVQVLLSSSDEIKQMSDNIVLFRGQEVQCQNGAQLAQLAHIDLAETKTMSALTNKTAQDSQTMRIATVVAMLYLPANLVLVRRFR